MTPGGVINAAYGYFAFVYKFFQQCTEIPFIRFHGHVDTCVDGDFDGFFLVGCHFFAAPEVVDVSPVRDKYSIPVQFFFQPLGQDFVIGVYGQSVDRTRICHDG